MSDPVDMLSFAELVVRMGEYLDQQQAALREIIVMRLSGPGPFTLNAVDHSGKALLVSNGASAATIEVHLPANGAERTVFLITRYGPAPVKIIADAGGALRNARAHNGPAERYSEGVVKCIGNAGGTAAEWLLSGDTAAIA